MGRVLDGGRVRVCAGAEFRGRGGGDDVAAGGAGKEVVCGQVWEGEGGESEGGYSGVGVSESVGEKGGS